MLSKTLNTEPETSFEVLVVKWNHSFHESDVVVVNVTSQSIDVDKGAMPPKFLEIIVILCFETK